MAEKGREYAQPATIKPIEKVDVDRMTFDGQKADLYINTGKLGGKHFLVQVADASGKPTLIAIHL
jgi:hypothetical protein